MSIQEIKLLGRDWLYQEYVVNEKSFTVIAKEYKVHTNSIRRLAKSWEIPIRSKSEAQALALKNGSAQHPTKGKKRSEEFKDKVSKASAEYWENNEEKREEARQRGIETWANRSQEEKDAFVKRACNASRKAGKEGSAIEKYLKEELINNGYVVDFHRKRALSNGNLEVDIFLPEHLIAIEIDGPSHHEPIWGQEALERTQKADLEKNGLLLADGIQVIRLRVTGNNSRYYFKQTFEKLLKRIEEVKLSNKITVFNI